MRQFVQDLSADIGLVNALVSKITITRIPEPVPFYNETGFHGMAGKVQA